MLVIAFYQLCLWCIYRLSRSEAWFHANKIDVKIVDYTDSASLRRTWILATLTRQGLPVKLQEQPFRILALLLESSGEIVGREDLRKKIWPDGTYVEFDGSLNTALMKLRAALNDSADNPRFIETVPRKGYRFIAPAGTRPHRRTVHYDRDSDRIAGTNPGRAGCSNSPRCAFIRTE